MFGRKKLQNIGNRHPDILFTIDTTLAPYDHVVDLPILWSQLSPRAVGHPMDMLEELFRDHYAWCRGNCKHDFRIGLIPFDSDLPTGSGGGLRWSFEDARDATLFKLFCQ